MDPTQAWVTLLAIADDIEEQAEAGHGTAHDLSIAQAIRSLQDAFMRGQLPESNIKAVDDDVDRALEAAAAPLLSEATFVELVDRAVAIASAHRTRAGMAPGAREHALAITHLEDAQMRFTRGLAMMQGRFAPADLEKVDAVEQRT